MKIKDILLENNLDDIVSEIKNTKYYRKVLKPELKRYKRKHIDDISNGNIDPEHIIEEMNTLIHGSKTKFDVEKIKFKARSAPRDTMPLIHHYVNSISQDKFGVPVRNGVFALSGNNAVHGTTVYGTPLLLIPIGDYKIYFTWDIVDFTDIYHVAATNDFDAWYVNYVFDSIIRTFDRDNHKLLSEVYNEDYNVHTIKTFDEMKKFTLDAFYEVVDAHVEEDKRDKFKEQISNAFDAVEKKTKKRLNEYVDAMHETDNLKGIGSEELIVWFDTAYLIDVFGNDGKDIIYKLITSLEN